MTAPTLWALKGPDGTIYPKSRADGVKWGATALCTRAEELLK